MKRFVTSSCKLAISVLAVAALAATPPGVGGAQGESQGERKPPATTPARAGQSAQSAKSGLAKGRWTVKVSKELPQTFTVKANEARLAEIVGELSKLLKAPIFLSPLMERQVVSHDFGGLGLEATLRMLAPHPLVDYEVAGDYATQVKPVGIYLNALNERQPSLTQVVKGSTEMILFEGDTEEEVEDEEARRKREEDSPLVVHYEKSQISVRARKQPLLAVASRIASELGIPFEMRFESREVLDLEFKGYPLDQAVRALSPSLHFYYRSDLLTYEMRPLRLVVKAPQPLPTNAL